MIDVTGPSTVTVGTTKDINIVMVGEDAAAYVNAVNATVYDRTTGGSVDVDRVGEYHYEGNGQTEIYWGFDNGLLNVKEGNESPSNVEIFSSISVTLSGEYGNVETSGGDWTVVTLEDNVKIDHFTTESIVELKAYNSETFNNINQITGEEHVTKTEIN